jgi:predicted dinucleotide-binding enzyme
MLLQEIVMKVGILGSAAVGQALAAGFLSHGHQVRVGTRAPNKLHDWAARHPAVTIGTFEEAAAFGELIVLAVKGTAAAAALGAVGEDNLQGKTVIDTTNPIADTPPVNGVLSFFTSLDTSLMEQLQRAFPAARFVKAFSCVGSASMVNPQFKHGPPSMFICGDDAGAKREVHAILEQFGWETEDLGGVEAARAIEPLCMLWCIPGFLQNDWVHALKMMR